VYWIGDNIQCVVGCFRGDLTALETKVKENYPSGKHHDDYMEFIRIAKWLINETKTKQERSIIK
jgi:hypothetical protein